MTTEKPFEFRGRKGAANPDVEPVETSEVTPETDAPGFEARADARTSTTGGAESVDVGSGFEAPASAAAPQPPTSSDVEPVETPGPSSKSIGLVTWIVLAAAVVALAIAFTSWRNADNDPDRSRGAARDLAMIQGTKAVETMNTMDHRDVEAGVKAWQGVSTGVLHDQLIAIDDDQKKLLADQGKIATGRVVQAALTDLKGRTARMIVAVEVTVRDSDSDAEPAVKRNRYAADLVLVKGVWKIEDLQQVAVKL